MAKNHSQSPRTDHFDGYPWTWPAAIGRLTSVTRLPERVQRKVWPRDPNESRELVRITHGPPGKIVSRHLNLIDADYGLPEPAELILLRNVRISFDRVTQESVPGRIVSRLRPDGYLFKSQTESLNGLDLPLIPFPPTVYRRPGA